MKFCYSLWLLFVLALVRSVHRNNATVASPFRFNESNLEGKKYFHVCSRDEICSPHPQMGMACVSLFSYLWGETDFDGTEIKIK